MKIQKPKVEEAPEKRKKPLTQDESIREFGFEIVHRPKKGPDIWRKKGNPPGPEVTTERALQLVRESEQNVEY